MKKRNLWLTVQLLFLIACGSPEGGAGSNPEGDRSAAGKTEGRTLTGSGENRGGPVSPKVDLKDAPAGRPNVVVVLLDTLRPDYLGFMGNDYETAPFLASLAKQSAVFTNALSTSSWTAPSVSSVFTGLYPPQHGVVQGFRAHRGMIARLKEEGSAEMPVNHMPSDLPTLPEVFKKAGYRTYGLAANINIGKEIGFSRGFDRFRKQVRAPAEQMFEMLKEWHGDIVENPPFFLYLHFNDPHTPYHRRKPYFRPVKDRKEELAARYRSEIGYVDAYLEKVWRLPGISRNTVLVLLSDHGEEFWDHGSTDHGPTLYGELNRVLGMVHGPSHGIPAMRVTQNTSHVDILPTLADLIGVKLKKRREGVSLLPLFKGKSEREALSGRLGDRCLFAHRMHSSRRQLAIWSITCDNWKLIDWWGDRRKLFDHTTDRGEYLDLLAKRPKTAEDLYQRLVAFKERMKSGTEPSEAGEIELDMDLLKRLRALGYVE